MSLFFKTSSGVVFIDWSQILYIKIDCGEVFISMKNDQSIKERIDAYAYSSIFAQLEERAALSK